MRESLSRLLLIVAVGLLIYQGYQWFNPPVVDTQPILAAFDRPSPAKRPAKTCVVRTDTIEATLSTDGAGITSYRLVRDKYKKNDTAINLATVSDKAAAYRPLRIKLRNEGVPVAAGGATPTVEARNAVIKQGDGASDWQTRFDFLHWKLTVGGPQGGTQCVFLYEDDTVKVVKTVAATAHPYELDVKVDITNKAKEPRKHALTVESNTFRLESEMEGQMFRVSPYVTGLECIDKGGSATRLKADSFTGVARTEAGKLPVWSGDNFKPSALNAGDWYGVANSSDLAAVSNAYFTQALFPEKGPAPECQLQAEYFYRAGQFKSRSADPLGGTMFRARFAYPVQKLEPGKTASYELLSYMGPKERGALATIGGGKHQSAALELIDLGFFSIIAKVLVGFLLYVHGAIGDWGLSIILLTITARTLLFPLMIPSIRMTIKMRQLKPEMDALNEKFKDDAQAKGLATMELYKKHKVNLAFGCLPQLLTLPVWFALYTTLQTAVELYNTSWAWFPDLTQPDPYFVLPFVIGGTAYLQQLLMPMTGGDPAQQQLMKYMMPGMMTVFMLFLPAGLGIYMFTNSLLGILQQQAVEWYTARNLKKGEIGVAVKDDGDGDGDGGDEPEAKKKRRKSGKSDKSASKLATDGNS